MFPFNFIFINSRKHIKERYDYSIPIDYDEYFEPGVTYYLFFTPVYSPSANDYIVRGSSCANVYSGGTLYLSHTWDFNGDPGTPTSFYDIYRDLNIIINYTADLTSTPTIENITCTSCDPEDTTSPYQDNQTTPTFTFDTDIHSDCRVHKLNVSYAVMGPTRNCAGGNGGFAHTCTLGSADKLTSPKGKLYVSCVNSNVESLETPFKLEMNITGLSYDSYDMIQLGIDESIIGSTASVLTDKKVYLKALSGSSFYGIVDMLVSQSNQRWLINYETTESIGLFNISPKLYSLDLVNTSMLEIDTTVRNFIDETKE